MTFPEFFYLPSASSQVTYHSRPPGEPDPIRLGTGRDGFRVEDSRQPKKKVLVINDWHLTRWLVNRDNKEAAVVFIQFMAACLQDGFKLYLWQDAQPKKIYETDLWCRRSPKDGPPEEYRAHQLCHSFKPVTDNAVKEYFATHKDVPVDEVLPLSYDVFAQLNLECFDGKLPYAKAGFVAVEHLKESHHALSDLKAVIFDENSECQGLTYQKINEQGRDRYLAAIREYFPEVDISYDEENRLSAAVTVEIKEEVTNTILERKTKAFSYKSKTGETLSIACLGRVKYLTICDSTRSAFEILNLLERRNQGLIALEINDHKFNGYVVSKTNTNESVEKLTLTRCEIEVDDFFKLLTKFPNLTSLHISDLTCRREDGAEYTVPSFEHLTTISISQHRVHYSLDFVKGLLQHSPHVISLSMDNVLFDNPERKFTKLEKLKISGNHTSESEMLSLLRNNSSLRVLDIKGVLEDLGGDFSDYKDDISFPCLSYFKADTCGGDLVRQVISTAERLESLWLDQCDIDQGFMPDLAARPMMQLEHLRLYGRETQINSNELLSALNNMPKLRSLRIYSIHFNNLHTHQNAHFPALQFIDFTCVRNDVGSPQAWLTPAIEDIVFNAPNLECLRFREVSHGNEVNYVSQRAEARLSKLRAIAIQGVGLSPSFLSQLFSSAQQLESLGLYQTSFRWEAKFCQQIHFPELRSLEIDSAPVTAILMQKLLPDTEVLEYLSIGGVYPGCFANDDNLLEADRAVSEILDPRIFNKLQMLGLPSNFRITGENVGLFKKNPSLPMLDYGWLTNYEVLPGAKKEVAEIRLWIKIQQKRKHNAELPLEELYLFSECIAADGSRFPHYLLTAEAIHMLFESNPLIFQELKHLELNHIEISEESLFCLLSNAPKLQTLGIRGEITRSSTQFYQNMSALINSGMFPTFLDFRSLNNQGGSEISKAGSQLLHRCMPKAIIRLTSGQPPKPLKKVSIEDMLKLMAGNKEWLKSFGHLLFDQGSSTQTQREFLSQQAVSCGIDASTVNKPVRYNLKYLFFHRSGRHPHPSEYRMEYFDDVVVNEYFEPGEKPFRLVKKRAFDPQPLQHPLHFHESNVIRQIEMSDDQLRAKVGVKLSHQWLALPSYTPEDNISAMFVEGLSPRDYEIAYDSEIQCYFVRLKNSSAEPINTKVHYVFSYDKALEALPDELEEMVEYYNGFEAGDLLLSEEEKQSGEAVYRAMKQQRHGSCEQRSAVFLDDFKRKFPDYKVCAWKNDCHVYVEIQDPDNGRRVKRDLGGYDAEVKIQNDESELSQIPETEPQTQGSEEKKDHPAPAEEEKSVELVHSLEEKQKVDEVHSIAGSTNPYQHEFEQKDEKEFNDITALLDGIDQLEDTNKVLLELTTNELSESYVLGILHHAAESGRPVYYINKLEDVLCANEWLSLNEDNVANKAEHPLASFLKANHDQRPILLINWNHFSADDIAAVNTMLDNKREIDGCDVPEELLILGVQNTADIRNYRGPDFVTRFKQQLEAPLSTAAETNLANNLLVCATELPEEMNDGDVYMLECYDSSDWEGVLLGHWQISGAELKFIEGPLFEAIASGKPIVFRNAPWHLHEFRMFFQEAKIRGYIDWYGKRVDLPEENVFYQASGQYAYEELLENTQWLEGNNNDPSIPVLNPSEFYRYFHDYELQGEEALKTMFTGDGLFEAHKDQALTVALTREQSDHQWGRLLAKAKEHNVSLTVIKPKDIPLPFDIQADSIEQEATWLPIYVTDDCRAAILIKLQEEKYRDALVMDISEINVNDLFDNIEYDKKASTLGNYLFEETVGRASKALKAGQQVILKGCVKPNQADFLMPMLWRYPEQLSIVTTEAPSFASVPTHHMTVTKEQKMELLGQRFSDDEINAVTLGNEPYDQMVAKVLAAPQDPWVGYEHIHLDVTLMDFDDLEEKTSQAFAEQRLASVNAVLAESPFVFLGGLTGVGKTSFVYNELGGPLSSPSTPMSSPSAPMSSPRRRGSHEDLQDSRLHGNDTCSPVACEASSRENNNIPGGLSTTRQATTTLDIEDNQSSPVGPQSGAAGNGNEEIPDMATPFRGDDSFGKNKVLTGLDKLEEWIQDPEEGINQHILFIDEANLSDKDFHQFDDLFNTPPSIVIGSERYPLDHRHKVVFAGNPLSYGGERTMPALFQQHGRSVVFEPLPPAYIYHQILKPMLMLSFNEEQSEIIARILFQLYEFLLTSSRQKLLITPRELKTIATLVMARHQEGNDLAALTRACTYSIGNTLAPDQEKFESWAQEQWQWSDEGRESPEVKADAADYVLTRSRYNVYEQLDNLLTIRAYQQQQVAELSKEQADILCKGAINGITLEGESGIGKSKFVMTQLESLGFHEANLDEDHAGRNVYYKIPASMSTAKKKACLRKAFREGAIVLIDEINTCAMMEQELNDLLMGQMKGERAQCPGFLLIGTQNPKTYSGRQAASNAMERRVITCHLPEYTHEECIHIVAKQGLSRYLSRMLVEAFETTKKLLSPKKANRLNFRTLIEKARSLSSLRVSMSSPRRRGSHEDLQDSRLRGNDTRSPVASRSEVAGNGSVENPDMASPFRNDGRSSPVGPQSGAAGNDFPETYQKLFDKGGRDQLLKDYIGADPNRPRLGKTVNFFKLHWNRHHADALRGMMLQEGFAFEDVRTYLNSAEPPESRRDKIVSFFRRHRPGRSDRPRSNDRSSLRERIRFCNTK